MKKFLILPASTKSVFRLIKTGILILFLTQLSFAQIVIEEKVEIDPVLPLGNNPVIIFPDSVYDRLGDRAIIVQPQYQPDNPQSTIFLPEGGKVRMEVVYSEAAGTAKIDLLLRQPTAQTLLEYANQNIGYSWLSEEYPANTNVEFGIYWYYNSWGTIYQGNEAGAIITQFSSDSYEIGFEAAGDDWDYNELVIEVVVVGDECDEEIVVCNNLQQQNFHDPGVGTIERLVFNSPWSWIDPNSGVNKNTDAGEGCNEGNQNEDVGLTYVMSEIGPYSQNTPNVIYKLSEDIIVETCLDESVPNNSKWRFKVKNVRVPIFNDVCTTFISNRNFIDLGDGTDISLLSAGIKNCLDLKRALADIDWEIRGGDYSFPCTPRAARYIYSAGVRVHEEKHFLDKSIYIEQKFNEKTARLITNTIRNKEDYLCPEDVLGPDNSGKTKREQFQLIVSAYIIAGANINKHMGITPLTCPLLFPFFYLQYNSELEASAFSILTYTDIRERILIWGKAQSWYDPTQLDCLGIN